MDTKDNNAGTEARKEISNTTKALGFAGVTGVALAVAFEVAPFVEFEKVLNHSGREKLRRLAKNVKDRVV